MSRRVDRAARHEGFVSRPLRRLLGSLLVLLTETALALQQETRVNLERLEDKLREHIEDSESDKSRLSPLTIVEVKSDDEDPRSLTNALIPYLNRALRSTVLVCDACQAFYSDTEELSIYSSGFSDIQEVKRIYAVASNKARPKAALWLSQSRYSLSIRIVAVESSQVLYADTIDTGMDWSARSLQSFSQSRQAERAARGDPILHGHWDIGVSPLGGGAHIGYSVMQQWGSGNQYLSGLSFNITDPVMGFGVNTFKAFPEFNNMLMGGKLLVSMPEFLADSLSEDDSGDSETTSKYTLVAMAKYPLFSQPEKYYLLGFISTNGAIGIGLSW